MTTTTNNNDVLANSIAPMPNNNDNSMARHPRASARPQNCSAVISAKISAQLAHSIQAQKLV